MGNNLSVCAVVAAMGLVAGVALGQAAPGNGAAAAAPAGKVSCAIDRSEPSEADLALSREEYGPAADLYAKMAATNPVASRLGTIRVLIEQNQFVDAEARAQEWMDAAKSGSGTEQAAANEAQGEALYRGGELAKALNAAARAMKLDPCYAQTYLLVARLERRIADYATAQRRILSAHSLKPNDLEIHGAWLNTLSRKQRLEEEAAMLKDGRALNERDRARFQEALAHANDYGKQDCRLAEKIDATKLQIVPIMDGPNRRAGLALDVLVNGKRRRLEIDTGASGILLAHGAVSGLGLVEGEKSEVGGVGDKGRVGSAVAHAGSVKIGPVEFQNCPVEYLARSGRLDIDGLIGADVFSRWIVTLDFPASEMRLDPLPKRPNAAVPSTGVPDEEAGEEESADKPPVVHDRYIAPEMKDWTPVFREGHEILLPVALNESKEKLFLVDTGAGLMSISPAAAREVTKVGRDYYSGVQGLSGEVDKVFETHPFKLRFAHLILPVNSMTAFDTTNISHATGIEVSGFLGAPVLNRLVMRIDYRDNLVKFEYSEAKDPLLHPPPSGHL